MLEPFVGTGSTLAAAEYLGIEGGGYELFPNEKIIEQCILRQYYPPKYYLLPQLERYIEITDKLLEKALTLHSEATREEIFESLKKGNKRNLGGPSRIFRKRHHG